MAMASCTSLLGGIPGACRVRSHTLTITLTVAGTNSIKRSSMSLNAAEVSMARLGFANSLTKRGDVCEIQ